MAPPLRIAATAPIQGEKEATAANSAAYPSTASNTTAAEAWGRGEAGQRFHSR